MTRYTVDDLLDAYRRAVGGPLYGLEAYRAWDAHVLGCMSRCFGVSFDGESAAPLRSLLDHDAHVPHPLAGYLEASLLWTKFEAVLTNLDARNRELRAFYAHHARTLADALWGELGERTTEQLRDAGWNPAHEPRLEDYIDEI